METKGGESSFKIVNKCGGGRGGRGTDLRELPRN